MTARQQEALLVGNCSGFYGDRLVGDARAARRAATSTC